MCHKYSMDESVAQHVQHPSPTPEAHRGSKNMPYYIMGGVVFLLLIAGMIFVIVKPSQSPSPSVALQPSITPTPIVPLKTEYSNPFDKKNSYENPFAQSDTYQNPFAQ